MIYLITVKEKYSLSALKLDGMFVKANREFGKYLKS